MGVEKNAAASTHCTFVINSNVTNFVLTADDRGYCQNMSWKLKTRRASMKPEAAL